MSVDKMVEQTKKVLEKQKELNSLVVEMKEDVRVVLDENQKLKDENDFLKSQILIFKSRESGTDEVVVKPKQVEPIVKEKVQEVKKEEPVIVKAPPKPSRHRTETQNNVIEFFLGKNVIVKIAAILMVLAVITFGQITYEWLDDLGRFILIGTLGLLFLGLGFFFEKRKSDVYGSIFYIIGLSVLLTNNLFGLYEYQLYAKNVFMYLQIPLMVLPIIYFYNKRYIFLDFSLNIYYLVLLATPLIVLHNTVINTEFFLLISISIIFAGFGVYKNFTSHMLQNDKFSIIDFIVLLIALIFVILSGSRIITSLNISLAHINVLMYQIFFVFIYYSIHFKNIGEDKQNTKIVILVTTTIAFIFLGLSLSNTFNQLVNRDNNSLSTLFMALLFIPVYVHMFRKKTDMDFANLYLIILSGCTLIFTFYAEKYTGAQFAYSQYNPLDLYVKNIIFITEALILFTFSRITKDKVQRYLSYVFMFFVLILPVYKEMMGRLDFTDYNFYIPTLLAGVAVYVLFLFVKRNKDELFEHEVVNTFAIISFIPLVYVLSKAILLDDPSVIMITIMFYLVGIRYLFNLKLFNAFYHKEFLLGINSVVVLLVFVANLFYFDHDLSLFSDVFKLLFVGLGNIYLIQAIREIGLYVSDKTNKKELVFIVLYVKGVLIQAIFITTFINFEFDKVILSSYYMIASAIAVLYGFRYNWFNVRKFGLFAIYFSLGKFFVYDFLQNDFDLIVRFISYFTLAIVLFAIASLYSYLEKKYGIESKT